jgi:hypothetical protein
MSAASATALSTSTTARWARCLDPNAAVGEGSMDEAVAESSAAPDPDKDKE